MRLERPPPSLDRSRGRDQHERMRIAERKEATRELLARCVIALLALLAGAVVVAASMRSSALGTVERVFLTIAGLVALTFRYSFARRP